MSKFPKNFVWGVACASYQCEGGWDADGKGPNIWDDFAHAEGKVKNGDNGDIACDCYHRYAEDVVLMKELGLQAYRFSISWSRVIPNGVGEVNELGLAYYDRLIDELLQNGIEPWVTLYHWDLPSALQRKGGWLNRETVDAFARFATVIAKRFDGRVKHYMTINEPQCVVSLGLGSGIHAPGLQLTKTEQALAMHHLVLAHGVAQTALKQNSSGDIMVGVSPCGRLCYPIKDTPKGREAAYNETFNLDTEDWAFTFNIFMDGIMLNGYDDSAPKFLRDFAATIPASDWELVQKPDFMGVNVYNGSWVDDNGNWIKRHEGFPVTANKWPVTPEVMRYGMINLHKRYGLPICITENGLSSNDRVYLDGKVHDMDRIDFLHRYLLELAGAIEEGVPVIGYLQWSFLDNFEWAEGYSERFGIVYVDYPTQKRIPKESAYWYANVIAQNGSNL
ncbi:MAG: GH1 family beta-glucosidase [Angelakisella sp.]